MGIFKSKDGGPSKLATLAKGLLTNPVVRTLVPGGNMIASAVGVLTIDKADKADEFVKPTPITNPLLRDIVQAIVTLTPIILAILELFD